MKRVIDSNRLQTSELRAYLASSRDNYAVLPDYAAMEAYKGDTLRSIYPSILEVLADYPQQVIVLKGTELVCGLSGRAAAGQRALIDRAQTREFKEYCRALVAAKSGDQAKQQELLELGREATAHLALMLGDMPMMSSGIEAMVEWIEKTHSVAELKILRRRELYTPEMRDKFIHSVFTLTEELVKKFPNLIIRDRIDARDTFLFRHGFVFISWCFGLSNAAASKKIRKTYLILWSMQILRRLPLILMV